MYTCIHEISRLQENLLLDEDSNIKLIDFGLVAEPEVSHNDVGVCALVTTNCLYLLTRIQMNFYKLAVDLRPMLHLVGKITCFEVR